MDKFNNIIIESFKDHINLLISSEKKLSNDIVKAVDLIAKSIKKNSAVIWCGNGGSAADSMHFSAEFMGRFKNKRRPLKSISLASDQALITCIANDFGYEHIFSRQIEGIGIKGDVLILLTTSGNSVNILNAIKVANKKKIKTILISGNNGGKCGNKCDHEILINSKITSRIQEIQMLIGHLIIELVEKKLNL
tara:strand:- start:14617 stop:15195 length:579 start_codon:yes stop_codon:yes gene_type:complete